ncbi:response regulator transcription factor, partial [Patescibacteria group bacterium]|nr:response regulator transcription factor [Patescibacteria group bacterium]
MNVLIVEDEPLVAASIQNTLRKHTTVNIIKIACNFESAKQEVSTNIFDVVLLDIFLGENQMSGLDLCEDIRKTDKQIPIIIITGFQSVQYLEEAFKQGVNDYIRKPFNAKELALRVTRWAQFSRNTNMNMKLKYENLEYDINHNQFYFEGNLINLTKKNKTLLKLFIQNPEKLLKTTYIKEKFWGDYYDT